LKFKAFLAESVTFGATIHRVEKDGQRSHDFTPFEKEKEIDCRECHYHGKSEHCWMCKGTGKEKVWVTDYDKIQLSNSGALAFLSAIGEKVNGDESLVGGWDNSELPELRRRLIRMKNGDLKHHETPPSDEQRVRGVKHDGNVATIERGPRMISYGRTAAQYGELIDDLLKLIDFAQKHDAGVSWA